MDFSILLITDEPETGRSLEDALRRDGVRTVIVSPELLPGELELSAAHAVFVDSNCGDEVVERVASGVAYTVVVGEKHQSAAVLHALRAGARDYLSLELLDEESEAVLERARAGSLQSEAVLEFKDKDGELSEVKLTGNVFTMGRDTSNNLCLDSIVVSRFHGQIVRKQQDYVVVDKGSRHGIFVNDDRVKECRLTDGAQIRLGNAGAPIVTFRRGSKARESVRSHSLPGEYSHPEMRAISSLVDTFLKLNGDLLLEDLLQIVVSRSIELADADRGMILLAKSQPRAIRDDLNEADDTVAQESFESIEVEPAATKKGGNASDLSVAIARNQDGTPIEEEGLMISQKIPEEVMKTGHGLILEDLLAPERMEAHPSTIEIGVRSAMCVPLRARPTGSEASGQHILGVLYVDSTTRSQPFSQQVLHAFESLASEAAQAIFNSQLYEECLEKRELDAEMRIARTIQQNILPPNAFTNAWMELYGTSHASREVGGDLLDYYPFEENRVNLIVGDVSGKGIPAAIVSSMLDGLCYGFGIHLSQTPELSTVAGQINRYLVSKSGTRKFVSVLYGTFWADGRFAYVNAGHNPGLWIKSTGEIELLRSGGMIMGMFEEATYKTEEIILAPGDTLILYSDGVTEARVSDGELFGMERLQQASLAARGGNAKEIHDSICAAVTRHTKDAPLLDDLTVMVVRLKNSE